jgi:inorganic pyrophosphatase
MSLHDLPTRASGGFHVVVESPRGARVKLKYEPEHGAFFVSRALPLGYTYPYDFGFVPGTHGPDGDPLDAVVYWDVATVAAAVLRCRLIGVLELDQRARRGGRQRNDRLVAVPVGHERGDDVRSALELAGRVREELAHFFTSSVYFAGKDARALRWRGPREARALVARSVRPGAPRGR